MILIFSDSHFGFRGYSSILDDGTYTAEIDCRNGFLEILSYIQNHKLSCVIFCGDLFHTNRPTPENIRWIIWWLYELDKCNIPAYFLTGNHDVSEKSYSFSFISSLNLKNVNVISDFYVTSVNSLNLILIPFVFSTTSQDKYLAVKEYFSNTQKFLQSSGKNLIVSHIYELSSTLGANSRILNHLSDAVSISVVGKNIVYVFGHIHTPQSYMVGDSLVLVPGSMINMTREDCNLKKSFVLFDEDSLVYEFVPLKSIRSFKCIQAKNFDELVQTINSTRYPYGTVVFIDVYDNVLINYHEVCALLNKKGYRLGTINYTFLDKFSDTNNLDFASIENSIESFDFLLQYLESIQDKLPPNWKEDILPICRKYIEHEITSNNARS